MQVFSYTYTVAQNVIFSALKKFFFFGYKEIPQELIQERMPVLMDKGAKKLENLNIEAYYLPAHSENNHIVVFAHTSNLWQLLPKNYDLFKGFADVVLWNPTELSPRQYKEDLQSVIQKVRGLHPHKTITIIGRCATVDPTIAVAADLKDKNINLVLDRAHGNVTKLARSQTCLSSLSIIQEILSRDFDCKGEEKIQEIPGRILFTRSQYDQLMRWGRQDLTDELIKKRGVHIDDQTLDLPNSDHWTPWDQDTHQKVYEFIGLGKVDVSAFPQASTPPTFFSRNIIPILTQGWC